MTNDPFIWFLILIGIGFLLLEVYVAYFRFTDWFQRKWKLLKLGINLIRTGESKIVKNIGWATLRLVLWESDDEPKT
jgi:hypothetical protein